MSRTKADGVDVVKGAVAGIAGGLVASWVMNEFQAGWSRLSDAPQPQPASGYHDARDWQERSEDANATEGAAQASPMQRSIGP